MSERRLRPEPLSSENFAPYGDVIGVDQAAASGMNDARFARYDKLATVDLDSAGEVAISIVKSMNTTVLPYHFSMVERHPLGSQAFIPLAVFPFVVVVAPAGDDVTAKDLRAFVTDGEQGINYHRGVWHMPLIALQEGQSFLVVDRSPGRGNCEEKTLAETVILEAPDA